MLTSQTIDVCSQAFFKFHLVLHCITALKVLGRMENTFKYRYIERSQKPNAVLFAPGTWSLFFQLETMVRVIKC